MSSMYRGFLCALLLLALGNNPLVLCAQSASKLVDLHHEMPFLCRAQMLFDAYPHESVLYRSMSIWSWRVQALIIDALCTTNAEQKSKAIAQAYQAVQHYKAYVANIGAGLQSLEALNAHPHTRDELFSQLQNANLLTQEGDLRFHEAIKTAQQLICAAQCLGGK